VTPGMFEEDIVYGGDRLDEVVTKGDNYVLFDCGIVAENVETSLASEDGATKVELILAPYGTDHTLSGVPFKAGTFASAIVGKVKRRQDGDLPAVVKFETVQSKQFADREAFVMTFVQRYTGAVPDSLPELSRNLSDTVPFD
jgi:hypothetical protein